MAKVNSLITVLGTIDGHTYVKSPTYGNHIRAARGTRKKAGLNPACQEQSEKLVKSNLPARIIRDAINPYRKDFYYGQLWQKLVSYTNDVLEKDSAFDFSRFRPFEIHHKYKLGRLLDIISTTAVDRKSSMLRVILSSSTPPVFDESLEPDGYRVGVVVLFPDLDKQSAPSAAVYSDIMALTEKVGPVPFELPIPPGATSFLVFVRVDACVNGQPHVTLAAKGMRMVEAGRI